MFLNVLTFVPKFCPKKKLYDLMIVDLSINFKTSPFVGR